jgi:thymidylate synthase (FAD)
MDTRRIVIPAAEEILGGYFPVFDHGFVALIDYMGGDESIEQAARCSYSADPEARSIKERRTLIRYLFRHQHASPFEQVSVKVHLGMPIFVMRQWVRHRTAKLNEYSGRYSPMPMLFYAPEPDQVCYQSTANKQGRSGPVDHSTYLNFALDLTASRLDVEHNYVQALQAGIAKETARIDLPLSTYTYLYWKCDLRNLLHLIGLRSDPHAQWEIRQYSDALAGIVQRLCPIAFEAFLDYQMNAVAFTQAEMSALRCLAQFHASPVTWENPTQDMKEAVNDHLKHDGIHGREADEFWAKLRLRCRRDFSLDLAEMKTSEHFMRKVADHSIDITHA